MSIPSPSHGKATSGRLFIHASVWVKTAQHSSKVSFTSDMTSLRWYFILLTADFHTHLKWGAFSGMNFHSMCWVVQKSEMSFCAIWVFRNFTSPLRSLFAPTKLEPWSLQSSLGFPCLAIKCLSAEMKQSEVKSETSSTWRNTLSPDTPRC